MRQDLRYTALRRGADAADKAKAFVEGGTHSLPPGVSVREKGLEYDRTAYVQKEG